MQRTQVLLITKIYEIRKDTSLKFEDIEIDDEFKNDIKPYTSWKLTLVLYELAITVNVFHTVIFWLRWYDDMIDYYQEREPHTYSNVIVRLILVHCINVIPPILVMFDFVFSKVRFNFRHWPVPILFLIVYKGLTILGVEIINDQQLPVTDATNANDPLFMLSSVTIIAGIYLLLASISNIKYRMFKDNHT